jgi:hypothetical protein
MPRPHYPSDDRAAAKKREATRALRLLRAPRPPKPPLNPQRPRRWQHLTPGERNRMLLNRRVARREARRLQLHPCPRCFEGCKDPLGHRTDDGCRQALDVAAARQYRDDERARRAGWLEQQLSPMPEADP